MMSFAAPRSRLLIEARFLFVFSVLLGACGGGGGGVVDPPSPPPPAAVASVAVSAPGSTLGMGATMQLSATPRDAAGNALSGRSVSWSSSSNSIATVDGSGLMRGVAAGPVTITATSSNVNGTANLTITAPQPVTVAVSPTPVSLTVGETRQLSATVTNSSNTAVTWTSSNNTVATVSTTGFVTAVAAGQASITATSVADAAKSAAAQVTVNPPAQQTASRVSVTPQFATINVGATQALQASAFTAAGTPISNPSVAWNSTSTGVASVNTSGSSAGVAPGVARIAARVDQASDTAVVAVLGAQSVLSTAFVGTAVQADVKPGQQITVPVVLDLSKVSATGDLGSVQFDLLYDPTVLTYQSVTVGPTAGSAMSHLREPGRFSFSYTHTAPQGGARFTLATITFQVATNAAVGTQKTFTLTYTARPTTTGFTNYEQPIAVGGKFRVVSP